MTTIIPTDDNNIPLPAMRLNDSGAHAINVTSTSAKNTSGFDAQTRVVSLYATGPVHIRFGSSSVTATTSDHYFPEGVYYDVAIGGGKTGHYTHVAVIRASYDCQLFVSEKQ